jgi:NTE family protein
LVSARTDRARAVRASIGMPGIFSPTRHDDRWLIDGGLVNPVPVSLTRALGADIVIAVDLNSELVGRRFSGTDIDLTASTASLEYDLAVPMHDGDGERETETN